MSRSNKTLTKVPAYEDIPQEQRYYVGYGKSEAPEIKRQSKYDPDLLSIPITQAIVEDGDNDPRFDIGLDN